MTFAALPNPDIAFVQRLVYEFRWQNHYAYYGYGIVMTAIFLGLCVLSDRWTRMARPTNLRQRDWLSHFGRETLFAYAAGNIALNLAPVYEGTGWEGYLMVAGFVGAMWFVTLHKARFTSAADRVSFGAISAIAAAYRRFSGMVARTVVRVIRMISSRI